LFSVRLLPILLLSLLLPACGGETTSSEPSRPSQHTLVFIDRSASTGAYPEAQDLFRDSLEHVVRTFLRRPGDRLSAFVVHEKTLSKAHRLDLVNDVRSLQQKDFPDEQAMENARFKKDVEQFLNAQVERLQQFATETASRPEFARWTDLWGTLGVASEEFQADSTRKRVYYFSDMFESMPGERRRNFDARPPEGRKQAEGWAEADAPLLGDEMVLRPDVLDDVTVRVLMGTLATKPSAQPVKFYWLTLFDETGVRRVRYN